MVSYQSVLSVIKSVLSGGLEMFSGKISLSNLSAHHLPWSNQNKTDQKSQLRPYLAISIDASFKANIGYKESAEVKTKQLFLMSRLIMGNMS